MKEYYKSLTKWFLIMLPLYLAVIVSATIKANAYLYLPGNLTDISEEIEINGYNDSLNGSVSSIYVMDVTRPSYLLLGMSSMLNSSQTIKISKQDSDNIDTKWDVAIGTFSSNESYSAAQLAAFDELKKDGLIDANDFSYQEVCYIYKAINTIKANASYLDIVGLVVYKIGSSDKLYPTMTEVSDYLSSFKSGEKASLELHSIYQNGSESSSEKKNKIINLEIEKGESVFGLTISKSFIVTKAPDITISNVYTLGPSGGAMQALYIYLMINTKEDLLNGTKVAGTGTISYGSDSNDNPTFGVVGAIGCIEQKLYSAKISGAKVFYAPLSNKGDCEKAKNLYGYTDEDIRIVYVSYLSEIIDDLRKNYRG